MPYHKEWVVSDTGILIVLSEEVISIFQNYVQDNTSKSEAGGILLGKRRRNHFEVMYATEPTQFDTRCRNHWIRSDKIHAEIAKNFWVQSNGEITYLGEWHTHPEIIPSPSSIDLNEWHILGKHCTHNGGMSMIIVGIKELWCGIVQKKSISQLEKIN